MASVSLVSSPQTPVLDKNMTDSELAGDERSSNNLMQFLIRSFVRLSAVGLHACVYCIYYLLFYLFFNFVRETFSGSPAPPPTHNYLHAF